MTFLARFRLPSSSKNRVKRGPATAFKTLVCEEKDAIRVRINDTESNYH